MRSFADETRELHRSLYRSRRSPSGLDDQAIAGYAQSVELAAVAAYTAAAPVLSAGTLPVAQLFMTHHQQHADAFGSVAGAKAATAPNKTLVAAVTPMLQAIKDETGCAGVRLHPGGPGRVHVRRGADAAAGSGVRRGDGHDPSDRGTAPDGARSRPRQGRVRSLPDRSIRIRVARRRHRPLEGPRPGCLRGLNKGPHPMNHNDLNTDEVRRQLRAVDRMNTSVMPRWRDALDRLIGDDRIDTEGKAAMLGVPSPSRRDLFKFGGATILGAALLAACGSDAADAPSSPVVQATQPVDTDGPDHDRCRGHDRRRHGSRAGSHGGVAREARRRHVRRGRRLDHDTGCARGRDDVRRSPPDAPRRVERRDWQVPVVKPITEMNQAVYDALVEAGDRCSQDRDGRGEPGAVARRSCGADLRVRRWRAVDARPCGRRS